MPKFKTAQEMVDASNEIGHLNFLNPINVELFKQVADFREKLNLTAEELAKKEETKAVAQQVKQFSADLGKLQGGAGPMGSPEEELQQSLDNINQNMGDFFQKNYQTILEAGKTIPKPLTKEEMDSALGQIGKDLGIQPLPQEVQAGQQAPEQPKDEPVTFENVSSNAIAMYFMDSMNREKANPEEKNDPVRQGLDKMIENAQKVSEPMQEVTKIKNAALNFKRYCADSLKAMGPEEQSEDYLMPGGQISLLRRNIRSLRKKDPGLCQQLCGPFLDALGKADLAPLHKRATALEQQKAEQNKAEDKREKEALKQGNAKKVKPYGGDVEITEYSLEYVVENVRNEIVNSPDFKKQPPKVDPRKLATMLSAINFTADDGPYVWRGPKFPKEMQDAGKEEYLNNKYYYDRLAQDPKIHELLAHRDQDKSWYGTAEEKFNEAAAEISRRYEPNRAHGKSADAGKVLKAAAETFMENGGDLLNVAQNPHIQKTADAILKAANQEGESRASENLGIQYHGTLLLNSLDANDVRHTDGAKECVDAVLSAMAVTLPKEEVNETFAAMNKKMGLSPLDKDYYSPEKYMPGCQTALSYIDNCKRGIDSDETAREQAARIFAARIAVDTRGGKADYLRKPLSMEQTDQIRDALFKNKNFQDWLGSLDKTKAQSLLKGHGGDLEKDFRKHLLKTAPGKLENDPVLRRYMPTAKERIEELQRQVKEAGKASPRPTKEKMEQLRVTAAAEIIAIRNACKVERNTGYGLNKQIPPAEPKRPSLVQSVDALVQDEEVAHLLNVKGSRLLLEGHGGQMMQEVREQCKQFGGEIEIGRKAKVVLEANTVETRLGQLQSDAGDVNAKLSSKNPAVREAGIKESRRVMGEFIKLYMLPKEQLHQDVPWKSVNAAAKSGERNQTIQSLTAVDTVASDIMKSIEEDTLTKLSQLFHDKKADGTIKAHELSARGHGPQSLEDVDNMELEDNLVLE